MWSLIILKFTLGEGVLERGGIFFWIGKLSTSVFFPAIFFVCVAMKLSEIKQISKE